jgi:hypothetical protein
LTQPIDRVTVALAQAQTIDLAIAKRDLEQLEQQLMAQVDTAAATLVAHGSYVNPRILRKPPQLKILTVRSTRHISSSHLTIDRPQVQAAPIIDYQLTLDSIGGGRKSS